MIIITNIIECFCDNYVIQNTHEDFKKFEIVISSNDFKWLDVNVLTHVLELIPKRDSFHISISYTKDFVLENLEDILSFICLVNNEFQDDGDEETPFTLEINIYKSNSKDVVSIYSLDELSKQFNATNFKNVLENFAQTISNNVIPHFLLISDDRFFCTKTIFFYNESKKGMISFDSFDRGKILKKRISNCSFLDEKQYGFIPEDFHWIIQPKENEIYDLFKLLEYLFSVISLSNISIFNGNYLNITFDGYKKHEENIDCLDVLKKCKDLQVLNQTYSSCYFSGEIADKLGIVRNLLPINIEKSILNVGPEFNISVDSNYKIYLKENVIRYIEIKQGIAQNLTDAIQKSNSISGELYDDLKKNIFAFLTFFVTILIFNTTNTGKLQNIFTKDISTIAYGLLGVSFIYLLLSLVGTHRKKQRFDDNYMALKRRFRDLLVAQDIENIFQKDLEHTKNKKHINCSIWGAGIAWILILVIMFFVVYSLQIKDISQNSKQTNTLNKVAPTNSSKSYLGKENIDQEDHTVKTIKGVRNQKITTKSISSKISMDTSMNSGIINSTKGKTNIEISKQKIKSSPQVVCD